ncbi:MAG: class I SAM-dependent methyltransferase [Alphaproteobacteria bacterium]|nr:class I SAM-dependent methyltransferase [Alphaproteobacteria bacterium]
MEDIFSRHANLYDQSRKKLIPCFEKFYGMPSYILKQLGLKPKRALDLGAGSGLLSMHILQDFGLEHLTLLDQSKPMLDLANKALSQYPEMQVQTTVCRLQALEVADYSTEKFDAVWSALAIHHLSATEKQELFSKIYAILKPGGIFINADQSLGKTGKIEETYRAAWLNDVTDAGTEPKDIKLALERMQEDKMDTLEAQLNWLDACGFCLVDNWFQDMSFNVYFAQKPI